MMDRLKMLLVFVNETDTWRDAPLYKAIMQRLYQLDIAGATANAGMMGFGRHHRMHHKGLFGVSDDRPMTIAAVDTEPKLRAAALSLREMARDAVMLLVDAEVVGGGITAAAASDEDQRTRA